MHNRCTTSWQNRNDPSSGQLRRPHQSSSAAFNVQVVKGKVTSQCLWHACRALIVGCVLMIIGAGMATVGEFNILFLFI